MTDTTATTATLDRMLERCQALYPRFAGQWDESRRVFGEAWAQDFSRALETLLGAEPGLRWDETLKGYAEFCTDALRAQVFFEKNGRYKAESYAEVDAACYQNAAFMHGRYLPGLYLSHFVWQHHYRLMRHYIDAVLPRLAGDVRTFHEVGVGCGMYSLLTLQHLPGCTGLGFDISEHALAFAREAVTAHGLGARYDIRRQDVIATPFPFEADFMLSQEVLEHLEDPPAFLRALRTGVRPGGWGFITAAINAGHTDHIYLYRSADEVRAHVEGAGWVVVDAVSESTCPQKPEPLRPTVAGFLVRRPG